MSRIAVVYLAADVDRHETKEALTLARALGGGDVCTYVLSEEERPGPWPAVGSLVVGAVQGLADLDSEGLMEATWALLGQDVPPLVLFVEGRLLHEVAARLAGRLGYEAVLDATAVSLAEDRLMVERQAFGGKAIVRLEAVHPKAVLALRAGSLATVDQPEEKVAPAVERLTVSGRVLDDRAQAGEGTTSLKDVRVVVSGGRGLGSREGFLELEILAKHLNAAVGASRAAVDEGWARPEQQVGLTGTKVAPEVYIAIGISGASQHVAGMSSSRVVLSVNADEKAPMVESSDVAFIGDWRAIWPHVKARLGAG